MKPIDEQLLEAVYFGRLLDVIEALKKGANPNIKNDNRNISYYGEPILSLCIEFEIHNTNKHDPNADYKEIFDMLIDNKNILNLNLNIADIIGNTALHLACLYGVEAFWAVKALLDANANATLKNKDGLTPFQLFLIFNSLENLTITDEAILTELGKKSGISFDFDEDPKKK